MKDVEELKEENEFKEGLELVKSTLKDVINKNEDAFKNIEGIDNIESGISYEDYKKISNKVNDLFAKNTDDVVNSGYSLKSLSNFMRKMADVIDELSNDGYTTTDILLASFVKYYEVQDELKRLKRENIINGFDFKTADEFLNAEYPVPVVQFGGLGPEYDDACFVLMTRFWKYFDEHSDDFNVIDEVTINTVDDIYEKHRDVFDRLDKLADDINPSGAMFSAALWNAHFIKKYGYKEWVRNGKHVVVWKPNLKLHTNEE